MGSSQRKLWAEPHIDNLGILGIGSTPPRPPSLFGALDISSQPFVLTGSSLPKNNIATMAASSHNITPSQTAAKGKTEQFTEFYYKTFDENRSNLTALYRDNSMLTFETTAIQGANPIIEKLTVRRMFAERFPSMLRDD
ncbi:MAG: hypothetical protein Q9164_005743 [Protoblastenia rupestris]